MKHYMLVLEIGEKGDKEVRKIILSEKTNETNIWPIATALSQKWIFASKKFPAPRYDIVIGTCDELNNIVQEMPRSRGWESVTVEPLAINA